MNLQASLQHFQFNKYKVQAYVPDPTVIQQWYWATKEEKPETIFPYWAKVWPAATALCTFIADHPQWVTHQHVLELAAGLGLPSLLSAQFATEVVCSDLAKEATDLVQQSILQSGLQNMQSKIIDWNTLPAELSADVLLLSDINYETGAFETLFAVMKRFIEAGTIIILSTPQRLMAKPFIEQLLPFCTEQHEINSTGNETVCTVMILKK